MTKDIGVLLDRVNTGHVASRTLDDLTPFLEKRAEDINERIFSVLRKGEALNVDLAVQAWYDKYALTALQNSLVRAVKSGASASRRVDFTLEGKDNG